MTTTTGRTPSRVDPTPKNCHGSCSHLTYLPGGESNTADIDSTLCNLNGGAGYQGADMGLGSRVSADGSGS